MVIYPLKMVIFHSYVSLPDGKYGQINKDPPFFGRSSDWFTGAGKDAMVSTIDFPFNQSIVPLFVCPPKCIWYHLMVKSENSQQKRMSWDLFDKNVGKCLHPPWNPMRHSNLPSRWLSLVMGRSPGCVDGGFLLLNLHDIRILYIYTWVFVKALGRTQHTMTQHSLYSRTTNALFSEHALELLWKNFLKHHLSWLSHLSHPHGFWNITT